MRTWCFGFALFRGQIQVGCRPSASVSQIQPADRNVPERLNIVGSCAAAWPCWSYILRRLRGAEWADSQAARRSEPSLKPRESCSGCGLFLRRSCLIGLDMATHVPIKPDLFTHLYNMWPDSGSSMILQFLHVCVEIYIYIKLDPSLPTHQQYRHQFRHN